ncbi:hypothetical protein KL86PLE_30223 [uncultured Pleomorphomonas sp.]|uniref:Uncharacterized protein n=1 Tax=uncultured Pleomorphomonas sp. TaxID=442121 RepID=A0A212LDX5_9HYPH|nr:hypothetical protein KL86PLE_30223 [uncultured Pleomorphomonas sp.]
MVICDCSDMTGGFLPLAPLPAPLYGAATINHIPSLTIKYDHIRSLRHTSDRPIQPVIGKTALCLKRLD